MNIGISARLPYDCCDYRKVLTESTSPMHYQLYSGKFINCSSCMEQTTGKYYRPFDLVDVESELRNQTRAISRCPEKKYNPMCKFGGKVGNGADKWSCVSTFDGAPTIPVVVAHEVCPIVHNNIPKLKHNGLKAVDTNICGRTMSYDM
jgi:hypothetical protein